MYTCLRPPSLVRPSRLLLGLATALLAFTLLATASVPPASAAVTAPLCAGATDAPVNPAFLQLTGQNEGDYQAGKAILIYGNYGDNDPTNGLANDTVPPNCAVRMVNGQAASAWSYCTDAFSHSCRNNATPNFATIAGNPKFDPAVDPLGPEKEKVIVYLIQHGYPIRDPAAGNLLGATVAGPATSKDRQALQQLVWCVSEAGPNVKTADHSATVKVVNYLATTCAANFTTADYDAVLAQVAKPATLTVAAEQSTATVGDSVRFTITTNVVGQPITLTSTGSDGALAVCGGTATLVGNVLTIPGADSTPKTITLCGTRASAGAVSIQAQVVPPTTQNLVWSDNNGVDAASGRDCQVYALFNDTAPYRLSGTARVNVQTVPTTPTTPTTPTIPTTPGTTTPTTTTKKMKKARLGLTKTSKGKRFRVGQRIRYTIRVTNRAKTTIHNVRVCDTLPAGLVYVRSSPRAKQSTGRYCWTVKALKAKSSKRFTLVVRVLRGARSRLTNRVKATSPDALSKSASRTVRIKRSSVKAGGVTG